MSQRAVKEISYITYSIYRAAFFSLVTTPAIVLFVGFVFLSFNNSIAGTFLSEARSYVADTPVDKVRVCLFKKNVEQEQVIESAELPPLLVHKEKCILTLIDADDWQQSVDSTIRQFYWNIVFTGFVFWCMLNINFVHIFDKIRNFKSK